MGKNKGKRSHTKHVFVQKKYRETLPAEPPVYGDPVTDSGVCLRL